MSTDPSRRGPTGHLNRVPPHDLETEKHLIGAALLSAEAAALVATLDPSVFYGSAHRTIAESVKALVGIGAPVDTGTVHAELRQRGQLDAIGGGAYLNTAIHSTPAVRSAATYADFILEFARRRQMLTLAGEVVDATYAGLSVDGLVSRMAEQTAAAELAAASSWEPTNLALVLAGEGAAAQPAYLRRSDDVALLYPEKVHAFNAEPETGKSWLALAACAERIREGEHALYIDFEAGAADIVERMLSLGVEPGLLLERFHYVRPDEPIDAGARLRMLEIMRAFPVTIAVIDGLAEAAGISGWNENTAEIMPIFTLLARPIARAGAAVVIIDHLPKDREKQGAYSRGWSGKLAAIDGATYKLEAVKPFARGKTGVARIVVTKDRHGFIRQAAAGGKHMGEMHLASDEDGTSVTLELKPPTTVDEEGNFRPTWLMARCSEALAEAPGPVSRQWVHERVGRRKQTVLMAIKKLIDEGYVRAAEGALVHVRVFSEDPGLSEPETHEEW